MKKNQIGPCLRIAGNCKLRGSVKVAGSKNATLPIMAASILARGEVRLRNVPDLAYINIEVNESRRGDAITSECRTPIGISRL